MPLLGSTSLAAGIVAVCVVITALLAVAVLHVWRRGREAEEQMREVMRASNLECDYCTRPAICITARGRWCGTHVPDDDPVIAEIYRTIDESEERGDA